MKSWLGVIILICVSIAESHVFRRAASYSGSSAGSGAFASSSGTEHHAGGSVSAGPSSGQFVSTRIDSGTQPSSGGHYVSSSISTGSHPSYGGSGNFVGTTSGGLIPGGGLFGAPSFGGGGFGGGYGFGGGSSGGGFVTSGPGFHYPNGFVGPAPPDFASLASTFSELFNRFQSEAQLAQSSGNFVGASSSGFISPSGGYGSASVFPAADSGLNVRFGESGGSGPVNSASGFISPPSGGTYGISTFSAAGQTSVDGKTTSFKKSTVQVNDNGKVTTYTSHDP